MQKADFAFNVIQRFQFDSSAALESIEVSTSHMDLLLYPAPRQTNFLVPLLVAFNSALLMAIKTVIPVKPIEGILDYLSNSLPSISLPSISIDEPLISGFKAVTTNVVARVRTSLFSSIFKPRYLKDIPYLFLPNLGPTVIRVAIFTGLFSLPLFYISLLFPFYRKFSKWNKLVYYRGAVPSTMRFAETEFAHRLSATTSVYAQWSESDLRSLIRRLANEMRYQHHLDPYELDEFVRRNITQVGYAPIPAIPDGHCATCLLKRKLKQCLCYACIRKSKEIMIFYQPTFMPLEHVGMLPLYSVHPNIPLGAEYKWRDDYTTLSFFGYSSEHYTPIQLYDKIKVFLAPPTLRGRLCGPMFLGLVSSCFVRGDACAAIAAIFRNCVRPKHRPLTPVTPTKCRAYSYVDEFSSLLILASLLLPELFTQVEVWDWDRVLAHQKDPEKKRLHITTRALIDQGYQMTAQEMCRVKPFAKAEKKQIYEISDGYIKVVTKMLPRCISAFDPQVSTLLSAYTLPMLKHLNKVCCSDSHIFYASGATPDEITTFLNNAIITNLYILEDDVSMADGSHSEGSYLFMDAIREANHPYLPDDIAEIFQQCRIGKMKTGLLRAFVENIILSGIPLTSWGNSVVFIFIRLIALCIAYNFYDFQQFQTDPSSCLTPTLELLSSIYMAVAGDDGKTFLPHSINGIETYSGDFIPRYVDAWARFGFDVGAGKIRTFNPSNWRLATFLAMRPYWSGEKYEYGPEMARRMTSMFWQLDSTYHPVAWARGICQATLAVASHVPVLSHICRWYLRNTFGSTMEIGSFTNIYSVFHDYYITGDLTERGVKEFLEDYDIPFLMYTDFLESLSIIQDVLVNFNHPIFEKIFAKQ
jgi:hypothetical protein